MKQKDTIQNEISEKGNLVVTAGAGTGKTTCLINKIISLIGKTDIPVERILAITFTEPAAAEMKERLRDEIEKKLGTEGENPWAMALSDLERAQISTIHALAMRILQENPIEAGIDPDFVIEEETGDILLNDELWETWAGQNLWGGHDFDDDLVILLKRFGAEGIKELGKELSKRPDRLEDYLKYKVDGNVERKKYQLKLTDLKERLLEIDMEASGDDILYQKCVKVKEILDLDSLEEIAERLKEVKLTKTGGQKKKWSSFDTFESVKKMFYDTGGAIDTLKGLTIFLQRLEDDKIAEIAVRIISEFVHFMRQEKFKRGTLTFFDLLYEAKKLLQENPDIRKRYQREFDYILVDEFQDTDPIQGEIVLFLAEDGANAKRSKDVKLKSDKLFIVGDPKQSIYRFREADIGVFYDVAKKIYTADGKELILTNNYRSQSHLIEFLNTFFSNYINHVDDNYTIQYNPLTPKVEDTPEMDAKTPTVDIVISNPVEKIPVDVIRENEANYIASRIVNMVEGQGDGNFVRDKKTKEPRAANYGDIAILMRKMTAVSIYEGALKREEVPYIIVGGKGYFQRQEINDLINILDAILDPTDKRALVGTLRSPIFGIDDEKIYRLANEGKLNYRKDAGDDYVNMAFDVLRHLHAIRGGKTLTGFIDEVLKKTEIMEINAFGVGGAQRVGNLMKIRQMADEQETKGPITLTEFIYLLRGFTEEKQDEGEAVITEEVENSVRIMTIHKAKGLEFPVVFLPDLGGRMNTTPRNGIYMDNLNGNGSAISISGIKTDKISDIGYYNYFEEKEKKRNLAEERRLFYVGASRARDKLILLGQKDGAKDGHMRRILEFAGLAGDKDEDGNIEFLSDYPFLRFIEISSEKSEVGQSQKVSIKKKRNRIVDYIEGVGNIKPIEEAREREKKRLDEYQRAISTIFYSSVSKQFKDPIAAFHYESFKIEDEDGAISPHGITGSGANVGAVVGSLVHLALEEIDFASPPDIDELLKKISASFPIDEKIKDEVMFEAKALVAKFLSSDKAGEIAASDVIGREVPIITSLGETTMVGRIDLIYRRNDEIVILDYKTDRVTVGEEEKRAEKYRGQIETYVNAVASVLNVNSVPIVGTVHFIRTGVTVPRLH